MIGIYVIENQINHKKYIGQSVDITKRWWQHKNRDLIIYPDYPLYRAFVKYGLNNFSFNILEECDEKQLNNREEYWIKTLDTLVPNGYNQTKGGQNPTHFNVLNEEKLCCLIQEITNTKISFIELGKKYGITDQTVSDINQGKMWYNSDLKYPLRETKKSSYVCAICGKPIARGSTYCKECANKMKQKVDRPSKEILLKEIVENGISGCARLHDVSRSSICRWCENYGLPTHIQDIINFYNNNL